MAIVVDAARTPMNFEGHNTAYQKGNDDANTPTPTWLQTTIYPAGAAETHITARNDVTPWVGIDNTLDDWLPASVDVWLDSTPATVRPA